jgi:hypothetical protein
MIDGLGDKAAIGNTTTTNALDAISFTRRERDRLK